VDRLVERAWLERQAGKAMQVHLVRQVLLVRQVIQGRPVQLVILARLV